MREKEYIIATNRVKVTAAIRHISDLMTGDDVGATKGQQRALIDVLHTMEDTLFKLIDLAQENES